jgi:polar amino acid transport system substrate-binding protein
MLRTRSLRAAAGAAAVLLALTACSSSSDDASGDGSAPASAAALPTVTIEGVGDVTGDAALAATLPAAIAEAGTVSVATNAPYPPFIDFVEEGNLEDFKGLDYDLVTAIAAKLGVTAPFQQQPFDGLIPGLQSGKYDAIVGGITDNAERQEVAVFVDYSASGTGILVATGNPEGVTNLSSLCGKEVAVQKATTQVGLLSDFSDKECADSPIKVTEYPQNTDALTALLAGKAAAIAATKVTIVDIAKKNAEKVQIVEDPEFPNGYAASPNGIGFLKSEQELATAFQSGLQALMDDGTYLKILAKYGQEPIAIDTATINANVD